ncbi:TPA: YSIRK-type signal peptide-containing protein [Streptococcus suis]|nr:YSIRK-type signal peptide-containing protein [Streptococcus suis]HEM3194438.1 YSIRK-type signal peptide-containing protein [Streptococcus suis 10581]NQP37584.1 YSIRK-type signal peptide-containing protein [Streptococcus suis]HEL1757717.1 YSIRK-type signal peptide-containing protein [Streptococcus suis]HEL1760032.1 YSIRK-type signal peptide-containing protein [Streptococcus suis]
MISKKCKFCLRKLTIGLVSLSIGLIVPSYFNRNDDVEG